MAPPSAFSLEIISQQVPDPQTSALKLPNESLSSKVLCFSNGYFLTRPWVQWVHTQALWHFSLGHSRFGSWEPHWFAKSDVSGVPFLGASLKSWGAKCRVQTLQCTRRSWDFGLLPWLYDAVPMWAFWQECVSAFPSYFSVGIFSLIWCVGVIQLISGFISEVIVLYVVVYLLCLWRRGIQEPMLPSW